jgi:hypothetical protein
VLTVPLWRRAAGRGRARPAHTRAGRGPAAPAIATEQALIARYHAALAGSPGLAGTLGPLLAQHREHLARLTSMLIAPATPGATPRPSASATAGATAPPAAILAALETAETDAARALAGWLALAPPALAVIQIGRASCRERV